MCAMVLDMALAHLEPQLLLDSTGDDSVTHAICCDDESFSLCGLDLDGPELIDTGKDFDCVECFNRDIQGLCPVYGRCNSQVYHPEIGN